MPCALSDDQSRPPGPRRRGRGDGWCGLDRRAFAAAAQTALDKTLRPAAFGILDGRDARESVKKHLVWAARSQTRIDSVRELYGLTWSAEGLPDIDLG